ncbi:CPCC family cysteine-rich protein [Streptomyces sp. NBC_01278]|uniref:CPCC family cysteine-rich protein n=1 Tax=Streptomyces sp. NBC_01278 TaxID=2903809 RepID=UPI002E341F59|nr:CPCC family cysteine-rich protein [Streptomyces sp. NBC_01278]
MATGAFPCIVCVSLTVQVEGHHEICPVCGWQDDGGDYRDPDDYVGGPNHVTLRMARENYRAFGASEQRRVGRVRPPLPDEVPPPVQKGADGVASWLDFVDNPEAVRLVYGEQSVPELDGVVVRELRWLWEHGPEILIRFDLPTYPADPSQAWCEGGFDTVQVQLRLTGVAAALEAAHDCRPTGSITLGAGARTPVGARLDAGRFRARVDADRAAIHEVTAYARGSRDDGLENWP